MVTRAARDSLAPGLFAPGLTKLCDAEIYSRDEREEASQGFAKKIEVQPFERNRGSGDSVQEESMLMCPR